jgi:hypothetical protein
MSEKKVLGRPTIFSQELANKICEAVATSTMGIRKLCALNPDFPVVDTIFQWRYKNRSFSEQYDAAKRAQADLMAEEITDIADEGFNDKYINDDGKVVIDHDVVQRSRLRVDARKWIASKLLPKVYGEKSEQKITITTHEEDLKNLK